LKLDLSWKYRSGRSQSGHFFLIKYGGD